jgi:hypothetical protein
MGCNSPVVQQKVSFLYFLNLILGVLVCTISLLGHLITCSSSI